MSPAIDPPLPGIEDPDLLLEVHTHRDLRPPSLGDTRWGDTDRLADLGAKVLDTVVTHHFFAKVPCMSAQEIAASRERYTSDTMLNTWLDYYHLKAKLIVAPNQSDTIYNNAAEMTAYFQTYVGAVYMDKGLAPIQHWISKLIDPSAIPPTTKQPEQDGMGNSGYRNSYPSPPVNNYPAFASPSYSVPTPPTGPPPPLPSTPPVSLTGNMNLISLSLVNQTAMQKGYSINYAASHEGLSHQPTWTVRCLINNVERGIGVGKSQKLAKEEAARRAWLAMGW